MRCELMCLLFDCSMLFFILSALIQKKRSEWYEMGVKSFVLCCYENESQTLLMFCTRFKQGERVFLLSVSRCGISRRQVHLRGVTRWESGILNFELVFGVCLGFIIGEIPAWPRKNGNYGKKLLPTRIHSRSHRPFRFSQSAGPFSCQGPAD